MPLLTLYIDPTESQTTLVTTETNEKCETFCHPCVEALTNFCDNLYEFFQEVRMTKMVKINFSWFKAFLNTYVKDIYIFEKYILKR